ncbi:unnamed protein product (macronuclear) [Paramecium tetraurelia]|uniref:Myb-like DNA-binding domain containing protein n=1 Tax=Paramecium tetraurelia TaxID=5888 RepID=A0D4H5_PARTE|nr:uncharacterized protein GSPATT00013408001 [Paramecium tetraurelia]CAK77942.1 unnamed protein product [Paramecium tetraurelia]|eukprot:XP_001445339.1 hypothetical protein (macronuclear) [Paramecium tetraurelia strain d4-2]
MHSERKEVKLAGSCEMEDLISNAQYVIVQVYPYEVVNQHFSSFVENSKEFQETREQLTRIGSNLRLKVDDWPTIDEAKMLFQINMYRIQSSQKSQNARRRSVKWNDQDKRLFYWVVIRYCLLKEINQLVIKIILKTKTPIEWRDIAKMIIGRNAHQCRLKWEQKYKISLSEAPWVEEEDQLLQQVHDRLGKENKWSQIAREMYKRSPNKIFRQPKQCRERWINRLDPNICNEPWSKQQEIDLLKTILIRGKKWSELSALYGRVRTENSLKNKYNSLLKKEKLKYEFETINPQLFSKVQKLRMDYANKYGKITPIEEIDNYEWQFIVLGIQSLYIDLCISEGKYEEAQKIKNDDFFDLFHYDLSSSNKSEILYKKLLNIKRVNSNQFSVENDRSGVVVFNKRTKKLFISPFNTLDYQGLILKHIYKQIKTEENNNSKCSTLAQSDHNMFMMQKSIDDINRQSTMQPLLLLANQPSFMMPLGQSMINSYWLPPVLPCMSQSIGGYQHQQKNIQEQVAQTIKEINKPASFDDLFGNDIKVVDSDGEK